MEWRTSNQSGRSLSFGDTLRLIGEVWATSLHSSAPALLHALRMRHSMEAAPYLNQARATYPGGMSELDAALSLLHRPDEDLETGKVMIFVEGAGETPSGPRPTNPVYDGTGPNPPYAVVCEAFPRVPTWCPALPPAIHALCTCAHPHLSPPPASRTRGARHRGQVLWQEHPGTHLLLLVVTTRGRSARVLKAIPTHLYGASPVPRPPLPALEARDRVHAFLRTQEVTTVTRGPPCAAPPDSTRRRQRAQSPELHTGLGAVAQRVGPVARPPPAPVPVDGHWPLTAWSHRHDPPPPRHHTAPRTAPHGCTGRY